MSSKSGFFRTTAIAGRLVSRWTCFISTKFNPANPRPSSIMTLTSLNLHPEARAIALSVASNPSTVSFVETTPSRHVPPRNIVPQIGLPGLPVGMVRHQALESRYHLLSCKTGFPPSCFSFLFMLFIRVFTKEDTMKPVGVVVSSKGRDVEIQVQGEELELGSIVKIEGNYGIVAGMWFSEDEKIGSKQKLLASIQVFGMLSDGRLKRIKRPLKPYSQVFLAGKDELEGILSFNEQISIGNVYGTQARAFINASEYDRHTAILASTGAGKSFTAANLIKEYSLLKLPVVVVDTHGEYAKLLGVLAKTSGINIEVLTVKRIRQGFKQLKIPVSNLSPSDFHHFIPLTEPQESALGDIIDGLSNDFVLEDLVEGAGNLDTKVFHEGTIQAIKRKLKTLTRVFKDVFDKYGTDITHLVEPGKITIIDCSLASQGVRRSVVSYLCKELLSCRVNKLNDFEGKKIDYPLLMVVEEAHNYAGGNLSHSCKTQLQRIASEGRKFGLGLCVISQKPSKIDEEILSQCNTGFYMHITNPRDKEHIRKSFESINDAIISDLDSLDVGECIIAGAMLDIPFLICSVDWIKVEKERKSKFDFKIREEVKISKAEYV